MQVSELEKDLLPLGTTALHIAVNSGLVEGLRSLLDQDRASLIDLTDYYGNTPLATALKNSRLKAAEVLIQYGASLDVQFGDVTIAHALVHTRNFHPLLSTVFQSNAILQCDTSSVLPVLAYEGESGILEAVLKTHSVNIDYRDSIKCTALHYAAQRGFSKFVRILLDHSANVTIKNASGSTALHIACSAGHIDVVEAILEADADVENLKCLLNTKNISGNTPVTCALRNKQVEVVQYISVNYRECVNLDQVVPGGHTLSGLCFYLKYLSPMSSLIKSKFRASIPCLSTEEASWLVHESVYMNDTLALGEAVTHGASVECLDYMQQTPLILAAKLGSVDMCKCLIEQGADLRLADVSGKTALVHAIECGRDRVVAHFLSQSTLADFDPCILTGPICSSSSMLAVLVSHFEKSSSKARNWAAWLGLVVASATPDMFAALVNAVAPSDWIQQLISNKCTHKMGSDARPPRYGKVARHPLPPAYIQEITVGESSKPQPKLIRSFSQPRKWYFTKTPPSTLTQWTFKHLPRPKKPPTSLRNKGPPFSRYRSRAALAHCSVIHEAALHNVDVLRFILASCGELSLQEEVLLLRDKSGRTALELVLPQFDLISDAVLSLQLSEVSGLDEYLRQKFRLSEALVFEEALVHYLCADKWLPRNSHRYVSPLQAWPQWYLQQQVNAVCAHYESGYLMLSVFEDRKELFHLLLSHNLFSCNWNEEYPPPLFAAIQNNYTWAVEPLLLHGADPATHYNGRFAIEEAIRCDQLETVSLLMQSGFTSFLSLSHNTVLFSSLSSTLGRLVSAGCPQYAVSLIEGLNLSRYLWSSRLASRFLFLAQAHCDGSESYNVVLRDFVTFLCTEMVQWKNETSEVTSTVLRNIRRLKRQRVFDRMNASKGTRDLSFLIEASCVALSSSEEFCNLFSSSRNYYRRDGFLLKNVEFCDLFHVFCSSGNYCVVSFLLEMTRPEVVKQLVNKLDTYGHTPLFHAACFGHLDVVRLLLDHGAIVTCNSGSSPLLGALLYLALAPSNVGADTLGKTFSFTYMPRSRLLILYRSLLPASSHYSSLNDDLSGAAELVKLLLPPRSESVFDHLTTFSDPYRPLHSLLILVSATRNMCVLEQVLERMASEGMPSSMEETTTSSELTDNLVLFTALALAPLNSHDRAAQLFESLLLHFVPDGVLGLEFISIAAKKGYWDVIGTVASANRFIDDISEYRPRTIVPTLMNTCVLAIKLGKLDLVWSLLQLVQQSHSRLLTQEWPCLAKVAVCSDNTAAVHALVSAGCGVNECLLAAARWGKVNVLKSLPVDKVAGCFFRILRTAARYNQETIVELLFNQYCSDSDIVIDTQLPRSAAFWLCVLVESASNGHESLALQAVACISESEINTIVTEHAYSHKILYYSCYWGLTNIMACLPWSKDAFLLAGKGCDCPLDAALATGKLGHIPENFALPLSNDVHSWFKGSVIVNDTTSAPLRVLLTGLFHQMTSMESTAVATPSQLCFSNTVTDKLLCRPNAFVAFEKLTGKFCAPFLVYAVQECRFDVLHEAVTMGDTVLLEQVLRSLLSSSLLSEYRSHSDTPLLREAVMAGRTACLELLLRSGDTFMKQLPAVSSSGYNLLHSAVLGFGHGIDTLSVVLEWLNESAPDMCLALDAEGNTPCSLAFRLGKHERAAKLLGVAKLSNKWKQGGDLLSDAKVARGWVRVLCDRASSGEEKELHPVLLDLRSCKKASLYKKALVSCSGDIVHALLTASCGMLLSNKRLLTFGLLDASVLTILKNPPSYLTLSSVDATKIVCRRLRQRDCSKEVEMLIEVCSQHKDTISMNHNAVFLSACMLARIDLVRYFLEEVTTIPSKVLLELGIEKALSCNACEVAAAILLSDRVQHAQSTTCMTFSKSSVMEVLFVTPRDYKTTVEYFFGSLARFGKCRHLSFSEQWLVHQWGPYQMQLLEKIICNSPSIPPNPWMLGVLWQDQSHSISVTIDWESFASCLQGLPELQFTPMLVEAVVFSASVLGQICATGDSNNRIYNLAEFFDCPQPLTSLEISAVMWPESSTACLASSSKGLLILSYQPEHRVFVFPSPEKTEKGWNESYSTDSGMQSLCVTDTSIDTKYDECNTSLFADGVPDLCRFYQRKLKYKHATSTSIAVDGLSVVLDHYVVSTVIELCSKALTLSLIPSTTYASIPKRKWPLPSPPRRKLFSHIGINIEVAKKQGSTSSVASLVDDGVDFSILLALENPVSSPPAVMPDFELLLQQTVDCVLSRELQVLQGKLMKLVTVRLVSQMQRALRCFLDADTFKVVLKDISGKLTEVSRATVNYLPLLKRLPSIQQFLCNFCDILHAYSYKPKVLTEICASFQIQFRIVLSEASKTDIVFHKSFPQLTILINDLGYLRPRQRALVSLTESLLKISQQSKGQSAKELLKGIPCPFLTHVDLNKSKSFLYPLIKSVSKLVVQVVSYDHKELSLPAKYNCCLQVAIRSPCGKIIRASSSEEPSSCGANADLLVTTTDDGKFEVVWTPTEEGLHSLTLTLNGVKVQDTFKRVYVERSADVSCGRRQTVAGDVVLVAAHLGDACLCNSRDSKIILTRDTVIEPSPFLKGLPKFTSPFARATSRSAVSPAPILRSPDQLKEAVSAMTGPTPVGSSGGLPPPPPLLHHISVTAAWRGSRGWSHTPCRSVTMHHSAQEEGRRKSSQKGRKNSSHSRPCSSHKKVTSRPRFQQTVVCKSFICPSVSNNGCVPLGNGMYRVSLQCQQAGTYKVFASCPLCQSVMQIYWKDEDSFYPELFYVLPGPFSAEKSSIFDMKTGQHPEKSSYTPGKHGFNLDCLDRFGNFHTVGKSLCEAMVSGAAGPRKVAPELSLAAVQNSPPHDNVQCELAHTGNGRYAITCTLLGAGRHQLLLTDVRGVRHSMATIHVRCGPVCPAHCWLDPNNTYEAVPFKPYECHIHLFDHYFNPCDSCDSDVKVYLGSRAHRAKLCPTASSPLLMLQFTPTAMPSGNYEMKVLINDRLIADKRKTFKIMDDWNRIRRFRGLLTKSLRELYGWNFPLVVINRSTILQCALQNQNALRYTNFRVRFHGENGIDAGGMSREFFHLLSKELVNPQYGLFQNANGLYRPSPQSSVHPNHLDYFNLCGKVLARMICDNYQTVVHFTPAVYKFLLGQMCTLEDLKAEDPTLYNGLMEVACCESEESLDQLAMNFTTTYTFFDSQETVELVRGGHEKKVTLQNKLGFVVEFYQWQLIGCVKSQLVSMRNGLNSIIPSPINSVIDWYELEMLLCGQPTIDVSIMKSCTHYDGYSGNSQVVLWLWEVLETFSQEECQQFLQFTTGSSRLPVADTHQWKMVIKRGPEDESLLPTAATCFNTLHLPCYSSKDVLLKKLMQAISYGHLHFLNL